MTEVALLIVAIVVSSIITTAVLAKVNEMPLQHFNPPVLGDRVAAACSPGLVSDWHVDYQDETLLQVTCYFPKTQEIKTTVVER